MGRASLWSTGALMEGVAVVGASVDEALSGAAWVELIEGIALG
jgi:hypothetical protein